MVDLKDPIQIHLLTETALLDSKQYVILSQEEVDSLKKQCQGSSQRIEQARSNLTIQTKYRDAAASMAKLYSPGKRRSLLGNRASDDDNAAEKERLACDRRCDDLATELWNLERRLIEPQRRLLEHTAAILQLTHKSSKKAAAPNSLPPNGIPGSPESLYTYSNSRNSAERGDGEYFDEYQGDDRMDGSSQRRPRKNTIEIPLKSPIREKTNQLRGETNRLREESAQAQAQLDAIGLEMDAMKRETLQQSQHLSDTARQLGKLNETLYKTIIAANPTSNESYKSPPKDVGTLGSGKMFGSHLDYLEKGLGAIGQELESRQAETAGRSDAANAALDRAAQQADVVSRQVRGLLGVVNPVYPSLPDATGSSLVDKMDNIEDSLRVVEAETRQALEASQTMSSKGKDADVLEGAVRSLWDKMDFEFEQMRRAKEQRQRSAQPGDDVSDDDVETTGESYSTSAFSSRVQTLSSQAMRLREQKSVLKRQIKQQRELNNQLSSGEKTKLTQMEDEMAKTKELLDTAEKEAVDAKSKLAVALGEIDTAKRSGEEARSVAGRDADALRDLQNKLASASQESEGKLANVSRDYQSKISELEVTTRELKEKLNEMEPTINDLKQKLQQAESNSGLLKDKVTKAEGELRKMESELAAKSGVGGNDEEIEKLNVMVIELKTELTFAKAELDGAYGSRAERAAEAAKVKGSEDLDGVKTELRQTTDELEQITKDLLNAEREKIEIENKLDDAMATKSSIENEAEELRNKLDNEISNSRAMISKLKEDLDSERLKVAGGGGAGGRPGMGATMLSEQFRATMREERKRFQEGLKVCSDALVFTIHI